MKIVRRKSDTVVLFAGEVIEIFSSHIQIENKGKFYHEENFFNLEVLDVAELPQDFVYGGFTYVNGVFTPTDIGLAYRAKVNAEKAQADLIANQKLAQEALDKSDMVAIRCMKVNAPFPAEWQAYVADLRAVIQGISNVLPTQPAYPAGT